MPTFKHLSAFVLLYLLTACAVRGAIEPLSTFTDAQKLAPAGVPKVFNLSAVDVTTLPSLVPFAKINVVSENNAKRGIVSEMYRLADSIGADVVLIVDSKSVQTGVVTNYGLGTAFSTPTYARFTTGFALRVSTGRLGIETDANRMVVVINNESARDAGLLEGDTLLSVDGVAYSADEESGAFNSWRLRAQPDLEASLVWIRPGEGRLEGSAIIMANPPLHVEMDDLVQRMNEEKKAEDAKKLKGF